MRLKLRASVISTTRAAGSALSVSATPCLSVTKAPLTAAQLIQALKRLPRQNRQLTVQHIGNFHLYRQSRSVHLLRIPSRSDREGNLNMLQKISCFLTFVYNRQFQGSLIFALRNLLGCAMLCARNVLLPGRLDFLRSPVFHP